eukprot:gb/GEZN01006244.1/.p1 GENE.gb/GEZN01006244.1/~~gb/GEZN01006244.1/.p1  ORF type:complete len:483 (+),score=80.81 gb/GEZN01006244.1/:75-1451(+)
MASRSDNLRQAGNDLYKQAADPGLGTTLRNRRLKQAAKRYNEAYNAATTEREKAFALKNLTMVSLKELAFSLAAVDPKMNIPDEESINMHFKAMFHYGLCALSFGVMELAWRADVANKLDLQVAEMRSKLQPLGYSLNRTRILRGMCADTRSVMQELKIPQQKWAAECELILAEYTFHSVLKQQSSMDREEKEIKFREMLSLLHECSRPIEEAKRFAPRGSDLLDDAIKLQQDVYVLRCTLEAIQERVLADMLFKHHLQEQEQVQPVIYWQVLDGYRRSVVLTRNVDLENEAVSMSRIGRMHADTILDKDQANLVYTKVIELADALRPKDVSGEPWYNEAVNFVRKYKLSKDTVSELEKTKAELREKLREQFAELKTQLDKGVHEFLVFIKNTHPSPTGFAENFEDQARKPSQHRKLVLQCIKIYHPDKHLALPIERQLVFEEVTKHLSYLYNNLKGV